MTEPAPEPPAPAPPAPPHENVFERLGHDAGHIFTRAEPSVLRAVSGEAQALLRGHSAALIHAAAEIIDAGWPGSEPVASRILEVALGVAKTAGIAL